MEAFNITVSPFVFTTSLVVLARHAPGITSSPRHKPCCQTERIPAKKLVLARSFSFTCAS